MLLMWRPGLVVLCRVDEFPWLPVFDWCDELSVVPDDVMFVLVCVFHNE